MSIGHTLHPHGGARLRPAADRPRRGSQRAGSQRPGSHSRLFAHASPVIRELLLVAALYVAYTGSRLLASDRLDVAVGRAADLLHVETVLDLDLEQSLNELFVEHDWLGLFGSYWYATAHYVVTLAVLGWLFARHREVYRRARNALALATFVALGFYLTMPTAPPRMAGLTDVLSVHSDDGWWGGDASAPRAFAGSTNELAAFPSMHAGWALWVALAVAAVSGAWWLRTLGFAYAAVTALVVVGTANHWVLDVLVGWVIVGLAWWLVDRVTSERQRAAGSAAARPNVHDQSRDSALTDLAEPACGRVGKPNHEIVDVFDDREQPDHQRQHALLG
ncbi:phosphatase PAP2 family protein [Flexivirga sp. ID2601S]|uniref:Phosphatase PAP2 family protein n=1 Tax=Flexivirga aerilata TaxID=1656889 RepID=A0A849AJ28_9MICO|nr:phosphatase PAP2 family protein [Flexivirga aerilata]NNG38410.1 phosphatase PAP2 family protein [Flexivirga aerilata]